MSPYESNSMKSSNPHSGIYEADTARTLDLNGANPNCNQGGMMIVEDGTYSIGNGQSCALGLSDVAHSLDCMHDQQAILTDPPTYSQDAYDKFTENDNSASLKACGGTYGGERSTCYIKK